MKRTLAAIFGLDVRSLALLRIGLAAVLLVDLAERFGDLHAHYGESGVLPLEWLPMPGPGKTDLTLPLSVHLIDDAPAFQAACFAVAALAGLALLVGWKTRLATIVAWFLTVSLFARNPLVAHGGDLLLRMLLFWGMFVPLGARWSLDARRRSPGAPRVASIGSAALLVQMALLAWFAALLKYDASWRSDGDAVYRALVIGATRTPFGDWLMQSRGLMKALTAATLVQEGFVPFFLFVPWRTWIFRLVVVATFVAFHALLGLAMTLGMFQALCIVGWIALIPTEAWEGLASRFRRRQGVAAAVTAPATAATPAAAASSDVPASVTAAFAGTAGTTGTRDATGTTGDPAAAEPPLRELPPSAATPSAALPVAASTIVEAPPAMLAPAPKLGVAGRLAASFALVYVIAINFNQWTEPESPEKNAALRGLLAVRDLVRRHFHVQNQNAADSLGIDQKWYLFAPKPMASHGWIVVDGTLEDGRRVDVLAYCLHGRESAASYDPPARIADLYPNQRWRKYLMNLCVVPQEKVAFRQLFAAWAAETWNCAHAADPPSKLKTLEVVWMRETTMPNYQPLKRDRVRLVRLDAQAPDLRARGAADLSPVMLQH